MYLKKIILSNFKNLVSADISFSANINCLCGNNGMGKTNLLDAIYYLSMTKSFLQSSDQYIFTHGQETATLFGLYIKGGAEERISVKVTDHQEKVVKRNQKKYERVSDHIGFIPVVTISPGDSNLINSGGEERRKFMNLILSQLDNSYLRAVQSYNRALLQRNKLLKTDKVSDLLLESISVKMEKDAGFINEKRKELVEVLSTKCSEIYDSLSDHHEKITLVYKSDLEGVSMTELLNENLQRDLLLRYTSKGLHRDDIELLIDGYPVRKCASQGQQKSFLIALKLAQFSLMKEIYAYPPILLLDDIFDKLDFQRVNILMKMVSEESFGQIFISDTNRQRVSAIMEHLDNGKEKAYFTVESGIIRQENG